MNFIRKGERSFSRAFFSFVLAVELFVITDVMLALQGMDLPIWSGTLAGATVFLLLYFAKPFSKKNIIWSTVIITLTATVCGAVSFSIWKYEATDSTYMQVDNGKAELYAGKKVMVFAPHEDDDICLVGGVAEEYRHYGSKVIIVFVTNGDNLGVEYTELRCNEALAGAALYGVGEEDVIFLGFGDGWNTKHLLWGEEGEVLISATGKMETYSSSRKAAYKDGVPYTKDNLRAEIEEILRNYKPDVIIGCDNDFHGDHVLTSLVLEEALGRVLHEADGYEPVFLKGFSYYTAYFAEPDFYDSINVKSTKEFDLGTVRPEYKWSDRVRMPVSAGSISRAMHDSLIYRQLECHRTQYANNQAIRIINGDRVYWQRRTDSLCASANITTSSGEAEYLNDMLIGFPEEKALQEMTKNVWSPNDAERTVTFDLKEATDVDHVVLYDAKDKTANVLNAEISFDDGSVFITGALSADGAGDTIKTNVKNVSSMTVRLLDTEGENAGLAEIEAFAEAEQALPQYIKVTDLDGNFVYDYIIDESGYEEFLIYGDSDEYELSYIAENGASAELKDGKICVFCPKNGSECIVKINSSDGKLSDTVRFVNANRAVHIGFAIEGSVEPCIELLRHTITYKLLGYVLNSIRG